MSQFTGTKCDVCPKIKGESNKWIQYKIDLSTLSIWIGIDESGLAKDACSDTCIQKVLATVLTAIRKSYEVRPIEEFVKSKDYAETNETDYSKEA